MNGCFVARNLLISLPCDPLWVTPHWRSPYYSFPLLSVPLLSLSLSLSTTNIFCFCHHHICECDHISRPDLQEQRHPIIHTNKQKPRDQKQGQTPPSRGGSTSSSAPRYSPYSDQPPLSQPPKPTFFSWSVVVVVRASQL